MNETQLQEFLHQIGVADHSESAKLAFGAVQALHKMTTEDVEDGDISCHHKGNKIFIKLESECFCMRSPYLQDFLSCIKDAERLSITKNNDQFIMVIEFSV